MNFRLKFRETQGHVGLHTDGGTLLRNIRGRQNVTVISVTLQQTLQKFTHTCNLTSVELEAKGNAIPPGLWSDPNKAGQHWLWDSVQNHLGWVSVSVENLRGREM